MGKTSISWTDESSNPIRFRNKLTGQMGWQCIKVSEGCRNCYAEKMNLSTRISYGTSLPYSHASMDQVEPVIIEKELHRLATQKSLSGKRVFLEDMSDIFGDFIPVHMRNQVFDVIRNRNDVTFQLLTKRPENIRRFSPSSWLESWPAHVWIGTSIENQFTADKRVRDLIMAGIAATRFLSIEPLLENIRVPYIEKLHWIIVGGESGPSCRPFNPAWAENILAQCRDYDVKFFMKQLGGHPNKHHELSDFPENLRVQEFPETYSRI